MALGLFDMLNEICEYKTNLDFDDPEIFKAYDIYMLNRYLSMIEVLIPVVSCVNRVGIEKKEHYEFLRSIIPKNRYKFNYIKRNTDDKVETHIKLICKYFEIGTREAKQYLDILKPAHLEYLKSIYSYGKSGKNSSADAD